MMNRIEQFADSLMAESRQLADRAIAGLRSAGLETAGLISRTRGPVDAFADSALKLNDMSHKRIEQLLKQQARMLDVLIDGSAERMEKFAKAKDVQDLKDVIVVDFAAFGAPKKAPARKKPAARKTTAKKRTARKASTRRTSAKKSAPSTAQAA